MTRFADLAGFTEWSSTRSPEDVFTLLESLYGAFDSIAKKLKVFKVETIGEAYGMTSVSKYGTVDRFFLTLSLSCPINFP